MRRERTAEVPARDIMSAAEAPQTEPGEKEAPRRSAFHAKWHALRRRAFRKAPSLFSDPDLPEILDVHRRSDAQRNQENRLPDEESVELHAIWALEYYTPAYVDALLDGLTQLGWHKRGQGPSGDDVAEWVRQLRDHESGGSWLNLGIIKRPDEKGLFGLSRAAPLPTEYDYAFGQIVSLTPSITCVMIAFVPRKDLIRSYERALRHDVATTVRRQGASYTIIDPHFGRRDAIRDLRARYRTAAANWFKQHLPGVFSSGHLGDELPTCELISLKNAAPFPARAEGDPRPARYLGHLDVSTDIDVWQSTSLPGLHFSWPLRSDSKNKYHAILAAQRATLEQPSIYGQTATPEDCFAQIANDHAQHMLQLWGMLALLTGYQTTISRTRDSNLLGSSRRLPSLSILRSLTTLSSASRDVMPIASELCSEADTPLPSWSRFAEGFQPVNARFNGTLELTQCLVARIRERATQIGQSDRTVRELISQRSAIISAYENVRIQEHIRWLTIVIFVLTAVAVLIAAENSRTLTSLWTSVKALLLSVLDGR